MTGTSALAAGCADGFVAEAWRGDGRGTSSNISSRSLDNSSSIRLLPRDGASQCARRPHRADRPTCGTRSTRPGYQARSRQSLRHGAGEPAGAARMGEGAIAAVQRPAYVDTMLRNDAFYFTRLGTFVERADNTARILDVKYHVLLPRATRASAARSTIITGRRSCVRCRRCVSYHWIYQDRLKPWLVAELAVLRPGNAALAVELLRSDRRAGSRNAGRSYGGRRGECHRIARAACAAALRAHRGHLPIGAARIYQRIHRAVNNRQWPDHR